MKGYYNKKYLSVPLWDTSVTNYWGMAYSIWLLFFLPPEQCCVHNALNARLSLKESSQCFDKGLSRIIIMIMLVLTEILIFCMFEWREQFTHSPRPATRHRPDSDTGRSNVGPTLGRQHRWQANAGPTPAAARAGGATASEIGDPGPWVNAINPHTNH